MVTTSLKRTLITFRAIVTAKVAALYIAAIAVLSLPKNPCHTGMAR